MSDKVAYIGYNNDDNERRGSGKEGVAGPLGRLYALRQRPHARPHASDQRGFWTDERSSSHPKGACREACM